MKNDLKTISCKETDLNAKTQSDQLGAIKQKSNREKSLTLDQPMPDSQNKLTQDGNGALLELLKCQTRIRVVDDFWSRLMI